MHATGHMDTHCVQSTLKIGAWSESESIEMGLSASRCIPRDERYKRSTITTIPRFIVLLAPKPHGKQTNNNRHIDVHVVIFIYTCMQWYGCTALLRAQCIHFVNNPDRLTVQPSQTNERERPKCVAIHTHTQIHVHIWVRSAFTVHVRCIFTIGLTRRLCK